jgi:hypothetical protein
MDDLLICRELAEVLSNSAPESPYADLFAAVPNIFPGQAADDVARPTLTITGEFQPFIGGRKGTVTFELRSRTGDSGDGEHKAAFWLLFAALLGEEGADNAATAASRAAALATLKAAVAARGNAAVVAMGPARDTVESTFDEKDLISRLQLMLAWRGTPA